MQFTLTINLGNDAMQTPLDVGHALERAAQTLISTLGDDNSFFEVKDAGNIRDENGNTVGRWEVAE